MLKPSAPKIKQVCLKLINNEELIGTSIGYAPDIKLKDVYVVRTRVNPATGSIVFVLQDFMLSPQSDAEYNFKYEHIIAGPLTPCPDLLNEYARTLEQRKHV